MPGYPTLVDLLSNAAASWPDQPAIVDQQTKLTWRETNDSAARVATVLLRCGLKSGDRVGVVAPKSTRVIASLHGVLMAGGVCVPVDPASPAARMNVVLNNCSPRVVIGSAEILQALELADPHSRMSVSEGTGDIISWDQVMGSERLASPAPVKSCDLAYLLYTSGSTGQPKGVMLSHENVSSFATWAADEFRLSTSDRIASVAPLHFDLSTFDIYSSARAGASLWIPPAMYLSFPAKLTQWMDNQRISAMYAVPSLLAMILERGNVKARTLENLRLLLFAGEVCPPRLLAGLLDALPKVEFANLYGPTETNVCTFERIQPKEWDRVSAISIGVPCEGTGALLINEDGKPIEGQGRVGELLIAGPTVAIGYWRDAEKSAQRFVERDGSRWCRTGDYVEVDTTGRFVFHGRRDHMIKIRGYRIELGEVESALLSHSNVAEGAVVVNGESLVAFVRLRDGGASPEEIREHCASRLPTYMVPAEVNILQDMPHGSTGKIDRLALGERVKAWTTSSKS